MAQKCFASISDTGLHCAWCITRNVVENGVEMSQAFCERHNKSCKELGYYCSCFVGYKPDYRMTDDEEGDDAQFAASKELDWMVLEVEEDEE